VTFDSSPSPQATSSRDELQTLVRNQLELLLSQQNLEGAKALLVPVHSADIAAVIEGLPEPMQAIAFRLLSKEEAIEVFEYFDTQIQEDLLTEFRRQEFLDIVDQMSPDDRVRLFDELPAKVVSLLLDQLSPEERTATALLLGYEPDTAGRIMTPEYISLKADTTVAEAIDLIRRQARGAETIYTLYVTARDRRLVGTLSLRDLVVARPEQRISEIMTENVVSVQTDTDQEEVARIIQRYDFLAVPVVDHENRLVGIVTVDDILDIVEQETTEDIYTLGGLEAGDDDYFKSSLFTVARRRVVWLLILLITNTGTSAAIRSQEDLLEQVVALAAFIPLLIDTGGNVGAQSSTVVIRGLNTDDAALANPKRIVFREAIAGIILGLMLGVVVTLWAYILQGNLGVALSVGISLFAVSLLASFAGSALPFLFKSFKLDPALMSAPFITTIVDVLGVLIYLWVARLILGL
jgi:magnesium transporter